MSFFDWDERADELDDEAFQKACEQLTIRSMRTVLLEVKRVLELPELTPLLRERTLSIVKARLGEERS